MTRRIVGKYFPWILLLCCSFFLWGCQPGNKPAQVVTPSANSQVATMLREFYERLGGEARLGPPISKLIQRDKVQCQYMMNAAICLDPLASDADKYYLIPLGKDLNFNDPQDIGPNLPNRRKVGKYDVYPEFIPLFDALSGTRHAGYPVSQVHYNDKERRIEQFFTNVAFYRRFDDPPGRVYLLPYGAYFCGEPCSARATLQNSGTPMPGAPFTDTLQKMTGHVDTFGKPITPSYTINNKEMEQVYEAAVVYTNLSDPTGAVRLRPVSSYAGITPQKPGKKEYGLEKGVIFYPTQGELGFHIPVDFDTFIARHGGYAISGKPITGTLMVEENGQKIGRQCFEFYCLDYFPAGSPAERVKPTKIGLKYKRPVDSQNIPNFPYSKDTILIQTSEQKPQIRADEKQVLSIVVLQKKDLRPVSDVETRITLRYPDGTQVPYVAKPTGVDGKSILEIPATPSLKSGSIISYKACLILNSPQPICSEDSYLIWNAR